MDLVLFRLRIASLASLASTDMALVRLTRLGNIFSNLFFSAVIGRQCVVGSSQCEETDLGWVGGGASEPQAAWGC